MKTNSKSEKTKIKILDTATDIFLKEGFAASRTSDIADRAGFSEATLFKYYKSKQGLLDAIVAVFVDQVTTEVIIEPLDKIFEENKNNHPKVLLKKLFMNRIDLFHKYRKYAVVSIMEARFNTDIRDKILNQIYPQVQIFGAKITNHYKEKGIFRDDIDPWITIRTAFISVVGMLFTSEVIGIEYVNGSATEELDLVIDFILRGALNQDNK